MFLFKKSYRQKSAFVSILPLGLFFIGVGCGAPSALKGKWFAEFRECLLKDKSGRFQDKFGSNKRKHILIFKENNQVQLIYPSLNVAVTEEGGRKPEEQFCDVVFTGKYSMSLFGGAIYFDFRNEGTEKILKVSKGEICDLGSDFKLPQKMPQASPYAKSPSVSLIKVNTEELRLGFSNQKKCQKNKLIFIYSREEKTS